ncbi:ABC transporter ATP-binding protein [Shewanella khirikhana]|uniref:Iron(3+)-hydroxamate import ATP-binding protein FhuC n=1 Tax=Shewanella khirikhana TaxID=1965282 RepID=A0ABM7D9P5_9GAMM|nr:ABC transporter ATP-binding protein [Shewanella khirikhana]AZQ09433.1 Iron(3+)-hydroxamate import ATP-binding protein FhuC [Shewanella khirikhana]
MNTAITVNELCWQVNGRALLDSLSFTLNGRGMYGVIGPNGAGKSSLLRCLYRFIRPDSGTIVINGQDIDAFSRKAFARLVAVVPQELPPLFDLATETVVAMGLIPHKGWLGADSAADKKAVAEALAKVGLEGYGKQPFGKLSGGEKQRALIARALVQRPTILILDEPTSHLDVRYQIEVLELLKRLDVFVLCTIHDLNLASALCDELLLLDHGRLIAKGTPKQVLTESLIGDVFGVCCTVEPHPQHGKPLIHYFYGYDRSLGAHI